MHEEILLQEVGLSEKEAKVYLACLQLGEASVLELAKKSGLKRPHVYNVVESLSALNLLSKTQKNRKTFFVAENPKRLKDFINHREEKINQLVPSLEALFNNPNGIKPKIKIYEGKKAMTGMYKEIFKNSEILFFGVSMPKLIAVFPEIWKEALFMYDKYKIKVKEILGNGDYEREYVKKYQTKNYKIRLLPENMMFYSDNALFNNKIAIISLDNLFMIIIESDDLYKTYKTLFELAWNSAIKIKQCGL